MNIAVASMAALGLMVSLFTYWIRRHWINEPLLALLLGVLIGPAALGWLDLAEFGDEREIVEVAARLTLAIALVSVGLEVRGYLGRHWRSLGMLVLGGTLIMWGASSLLVGWLLGLGVLPSLLIGAVLAPIDPILAASVATGRVARENLPERTRHLLSAESGIRHGLGLLWVLLPALLLREPAGEAWKHWLSNRLLWKGVLAIGLGSAVGYAVGRGQAWSVARGAAEDEWGPLTAILLALSLAVVSLVELIGSDGLLAVLAAGIAFAWARTGAEQGEQLVRQQRHYQETIKQVLQVPVFVLLGLVLPWAEWAELGWAGVAFVVMVLLLRRIPALLLLKPLIPQIHRWDEALFVGWFGPIGVGALYLATVAHKETQLEQVWLVVTLLVAATIVAHDLTATPFSR